MADEFKIPEGFEVGSFTGTVLIPQPPKLKAYLLGAWYQQKPQPPREETVTADTFPAFDLQNFDSYTVEVRGEFELLGLYLYTTSSRYAGTWPVMHCVLRDRKGESWAASRLAIHIVPECTVNKLIWKQIFEKKPGRGVTLINQEGRLEFPSKEAIANMLKVLEPTDSVTIAKIAAAQ